MKKNINLLPPHEQKNLSLEKSANLFLDFGIWLILSLIVVIAVLVVSRIVIFYELNSTLIELEAEVQALNSIESNELQKEVAAFNRNLANFEILRVGHQNWSEIFLELGSNLPTDLTIDQMEYDQETRQVELSGRAGSRGSVLLYRQTLISSKLFENVNFPLKNLEKAADLPWSLRFFVAESHSSHVSSPSSP